MPPERTSLVPPEWTRLEHGSGRLEREGNRFECKRDRLEHGRGRLERESGRLEHERDG